MEQKNAIAAPAAPTETDLAEIIARPAGVFDPRVVAAIRPVAQLMAKSSLAVPEWLRENEGGCFAVCVDAARWGVNPFGLAKDSFCVNGGVPSYGGKSTYAIIRRLVGDLEHRYIGDWTKVQGKVAEKVSQKGTKYYTPAWKREDEDGLGIEVWRDDKKLTLLLTQCTVRNSTNWANNPQLQIYYQACKVWGRMYCPDALLGFYTVDEMAEADRVDMVNITPAPAADPSGKVSALKARLGMTDAAPAAEHEKAPEMPELPELPPETAAPKKRSEIIANEIAAQGAPVELDAVLAYLRNNGVADVDTDSAWPLTARRKFDADPGAAVREMVNRMLDKGLI